MLFTKNRHWYKRRRATCNFSHRLVNVMPNARKNYDWNPGTAMLFCVMQMATFRSMFFWSNRRCWRSFSNTVDISNAVLQKTGIGTSADVLRVTLATDSSGVMQNRKTTLEIRHSECSFM